jgi:hypothetical protein
MVQHLLNKTVDIMLQEKYNITGDKGHRFVSPCPQGNRSLNPICRSPAAGDGLEVLFWKNVYTVPGKTP